MATRKSSRLNGPPAKARKVDSQSNAGAIAVEEPKPPIFNLINHCCYAILDWLSLDDLRSFGQTCKWAQQVAASFYKMTHSAIVLEVNSSNHISGSDVFDLENAPNILIKGIRLDPYRHVKSYCTQPIKEIHLQNTTLSVAKVDCLKKPLGTVERVILDQCTINGDFYNKFLKFCTNIKVLCVGSGYCRNPNGDHILIGADNGWLTRKYPTLELLGVIPTIAQKVDELKTFFEQNPNVRVFVTDSAFLEENWDWFKTANLNGEIKLEKLAIRFDNSDSAMGICDNLNTLHEFGAFQRLTCYTECISDQVASLNAMEKLAVTSWSADDCANISPLLINIKVLSIDYVADNSHMETTARNLVNIERVYLSEPISAVIVSFIRHSPKLKEIQVEYSTKMPNSTENGLDLAAWNKERKKLAGARKVTIYVGEGVYLATKWATTKTNYSFIKLKRENSYDRDDDFIEDV